MMHTRSQSELLLCLDQGGHASRALVFNSSGEKLAEASCATQTRVDGLRVELDAAALLAGLRQAMREVCLQLGDGQRRLVAAGLATQRSNIACWQRDSGEPLAPVLSWQDRRAGALLEGLELGKVHQLTGLYANPHYGASKLAWCLQHLPAVATAAEAHTLWLGPMASFLAQGLTGGEALADPANASRTLLYDLQRRNWDAGLCRHFGIDPLTLPRCVPNRYPYGDLSLPGGQTLPLQLLTGDLSAAAFVHGAPQGDTAYITLGTGAFIQRILAQRQETDLRLLNGIVWHDGEQGLYSLEGTVNGAGSALSWLALDAGLDEHGLDAQLAQWCAQVETPPLFLNGVSGLGSPFWQAGFESCFVGEGDVAERAVAVVESICFLLLENLQLMDRYLPPPRRLLVSGGLSALDALCQRLADLSGIEVQRSAESEGTAKGLAYLLAGMPAHWPTAIECGFLPQANPALAQRHRQWQALLYQQTGYTGFSQREAEL